jgi:hypothetical protein
MLFAPPQQSHILNKNLFTKYIRILITIDVKGKGKVIPITGLCGPEGG